jgi:hypothetical protein
MKSSDRDPKKAITAGIIVTVAGAFVLGIVTNMIQPSFLREPIWQIVGAVVAILGTLTSLLVEWTGFRSRSRDLSKQGEVFNYRVRMDSLLKSLQSASAEVDSILQEITEVSQAREQRLRTLESKLEELSKHEKELQSRIDSLKTVTLPVVEYFLQSTEKAEKRSAFRDYLLFILGIIVSTVVTVLLKIAFGL